jgi:hypothetical protein
LSLNADHVLGREEGGTEKRVKGERGEGRDRREEEEEGRSIVMRILTPLLSRQGLAMAGN